MRMKTNEVGDWLQQIAGKRDHRQIVLDDDKLVLRPGPNFHWFMGQGGSPQTEPLRTAPGPTPAGDDHRRPGEDEAA